MTDEELKTKFRNLTKKVLSKNQIENFVNYIHRLEEIDEVAKLTDLYTLRSPSSSILIRSSSIARISSIRTSSQVISAPKNLNKIAC